jgi:hypothetical protein
VERDGVAGEVIVGDGTNGGFVDIKRDEAEGEVGED